MGAGRERQPVSRVALQAGTAWVRVAVDEARPHVVAELPAGGATASDVLAGLLEVPVDELLLVHPAGRCPADVEIPLTVARSVRVVASAEAATADVGDAVVVDLGNGGAEVALVRAGRIAALRRVGVGGARLDVVIARLLARTRPPGPSIAVSLADARRVREALSLLPAVAPVSAAALRAPAVDAPARDGFSMEAPALDPSVVRDALVAPLSVLVDAVRAVLAVAGRDPPPVLLVGGVARTPLLAELLDAAGIDGVRVAERPDAAAVLGALRLPRDRLSAPLPRGPGPGLPTAGRRWLPPVAASPRRGRRWIGACGAVTAAAGLLGAGAVLPPPAVPSEAAPAQQLIQYGYVLDLPAGWAHTGGLPERRRSLLTPLAAPDGSDLISVELVPVGYDTGAELRRAHTELKAAFDAAVADGAPLSGFADDASYAGRPVVVYQDSGDADVDVTVDWYVVLDGAAQLSVGCRHTGAGARDVAAACAAVVRSLRRVA
jgi:type VII secretion-associated protein (TIGR03931 family)